MAPVADSIDERERPIPEYEFAGRRMIDRQKASIAPDFEAKDTEGRRLRLSDYKGNKSVLLVFNRGFG